MRVQLTKVRRKVITRNGKTDSTIFPMQTCRADKTTHLVVKSSLASGKDNKVNTKVVILKVKACVSYIFFSPYDSTSITMKNKLFLFSRY